jgi:hypothetical protein
VAPVSGVVARAENRDFLIYPEVDMEMKAKVLASVDISGLPEASRRANATPSLMTFLKAL